ncbi:DUF374 domain-containing protein [Arsenicitalea aurantiaca]|uniref:DUF374 domain-containing protein n=1 Tax=Arsenicitalea aurantiaca TaxID=1783274 RepID=A0A433XB03_9HYPH|nr:DUF374 domain-containing protein [Arsenicitalea aurantiaca]RUT31188.1 DUF374 domain-containing protein [Arsenicitalea aurantiaca]
MTPSPGPDGPAESRGLIDALWLRRLVGRLLALYTRFVRRTSRIVDEPSDLRARSAALEPAIYVSWHANILAIPLIVPDPKRVVALASPHPDGQIAAEYGRAFGMTAVLGTGMSFKQVHGTGGMAGFRNLLRGLRDGRSVYLCAEVPPVPGRAVSKGVIALARKSGRPLVPLAAASSRRTIIERLWDRMQINHPGSLIVTMMGEPLEVGPEMDDETAAATLKARLDALYAEALARADR